MFQLVIYIYLAILPAKTLPTFVRVGHKVKNHFLFFFIFLMTPKFCFLHVYLVILTPAKTLVNRSNYLSERVGHT